MPFSAPCKAVKETAVTNLCSNIGFDINHFIEKSMIINAVL